MFYENFLRTSQFLTKYVLYRIIEIQIYGILPTSLKPQSR